MRNVAVIGMGHVGATVAFTLFTHGIVDNLYLLDKNQAKAEAEYNDLRDPLVILLRQLKLEIDLVNLKLILRMLRK